jgi:branched-chain amino acid transport system permease protein
VSFAARARWNVLEVAFWLAALATVFLLPSKHLILTEIAILALFALSLDLILGYAGIVSLGHAAFFGFGAYAAGILAKYGIIKEPVLALLASGVAAAALGFVTSFLVLRGSDLTRLMVTLGVALVLREIANRLEITGGADGLQGVVMEPVLGHFAFDIFGKTAYVYCLIVLFILFVIARRIVNSPVRPVAAVRCAATRCALPAIGITSTGRLGRGLHHRGRLRGVRGRAADAGDAVRLALGARLRAFRRRDADADHRRYRLSLRRP